MLNMSTTLLIYQIYLVSNTTDWVLVRRNLPQTTPPPTIMMMTTNTTTTTTTPVCYSSSSNLSFNFWLFSSTIWDLPSRCLTLRSRNVPSSRRSLRPDKTKVQSGTGRRRVGFPVLVRPTQLRSKEWIVSFQELLTLCFEYLLSSCSER